VLFALDGKFIREWKKDGKEQNETIIDGWEALWKKQLEFNLRFFWVRFTAVWVVHELRAFQ
jgi:hypothetical protein